MSHGRMEMASEYRVAAARIVATGLNQARGEIRSQVVSGLVNPLAFRGVSDQGGFEPTKIDAMMDRVIESLVSSRMPGVIYCSEESPRNLYPEPGDIVAWSDPLDGTTNAFTFFGGYAVVLYFDRFIHGRYDHLAGAIASSDGTIVSWQRFHDDGEVWIDWPDEMRWPGLKAGSENGVARTPATPPYRVGVGRIGDDDPLATAGRVIPLFGGVRKRLASVASTVSRREDLDRILDLGREDGPPDRQTDMVLSTLAGNPLVSALLVGQLGAIVEPHAVKLHDAAYLIPLVLAGGVVVDLNDNEINVFRAFEQVEPARRRVGPFIAAASEESVRWLMSRRRAVPESRG
ncbi:MAG TPA: hypothetical protein VF054_19040 [Micromonosporaceae bacterium]